MHAKLQKKLCLEFAVQVQLGL